LLIPAKVWAKSRKAESLRGNFTHHQCPVTGITIPRDKQKKIALFWM